MFGIKGIHGSSFTRGFRGRQPQTLVAVNSHLGIENVAAPFREAAAVASLGFGIGSLLDLLQAWLGAANPISCFVDLSRIHWNRAF
jgi:hypothetical protein